MNVVDGTTIAEGLPRPKRGIVTRVGEGTIWSWFGEIVTRRDLLLMLAWREIRIKYKQSVMGLMWAVLMPTLVVSAGIVVKFAMASISGQPLERTEIINVAVRSVPWAFFVASIRFGSSSLISNSNLVTKIYMPRVIFPLSAVLSQLMDFAVAATVLAIFLAFTGVTLTAHLLWIPVLLVLLIMLVTGIAIFVSAAGLFLRDVKYIVEVIVTFAIFFTPVFYDVATFGKYERLLLLNPVAPILEGMSASVLGRPIPYPGALVYSAAVAVVGVIAALAFFKRTEPYFAESA